MKKRFLIVGSGGREAAFAMKLADDAIVYAVIDHENPSIVDYVHRSGGQYCVGSSKDCPTVVNFAKQQAIDYAFVNSDEPLANGVVDALLAAGFPTIGGTKAATRIEWDKVYSMECVHAVAPEAVPLYKIVDTAESIADALDEFKNKQMMVVVKPQGLTGGKGVKVMPLHLADYKAAQAYALQLLQEKPNEKVLICEKLNGKEFTIMGLSDGKNLVLAPTTYDYPFRYDGDTGPGTGGMGCYTMPDGKLPFLDNQDIEFCRQLMQKIIDKMANDNLNFSGVLNGGFFKTNAGIRFMEFNSRFGDPESLNILMLLESSFSKILIQQWEKRLTASAVQFKKQASVIKYVVAKDYPYPSPHALTFNVEEAAIKQQALSLLMGACVRSDTGFLTLKKSRVLAIGCINDDLTTAATSVNNAIDSYVHAEGKIDYRRDIGIAL